MEQMPREYDLFTLVQQTDAGQFLLPIVQGFRRIVEGGGWHFQRKFEGGIPVFASGLEGLQKMGTAEGFGIRA